MSTEEPSTPTPTEIETEAKYTFKANSSPIQVDIITKCINEARIFTKEITMKLLIIITVR